MLDFEQRLGSSTSSREISRRTLLIAAGTGLLGGLILNPHKLFNKFVDILSEFYSTEGPVASLRGLNSNVSLVAASDRRFTIESLIDLFSPAKVEAAIETAQTVDGMILGKQVSYRSGDWNPTFPRTAEVLRLPTLHAEWWGAHALNDLGVPGHIWEQAIKMADFIIDNRSEKKLSAGNCIWLAVSELLEQKPQVYPGEVYAWGETGVKRIGRLKQQASVIVSSGAICVPIPPTPDVLRFCAVNKTPVVIETPIDWYRAFLGITADGLRVRTTDLGSSFTLDLSPDDQEPPEPADIDLLTSGIKTAWAVFRADSNPTNFAPSIVRATQFYRFENIARDNIRRRL